MSRFLFGPGGKWIILPSLVFKTALFTVVIIIKSPPSTATRSKIACVFRRWTWDTAPVVCWWQKKTWRPNIWVFAYKPGSVLGYLITLLCTALIGIHFFTFSQTPILDTWNHPAWSSAYFCAKQEYSMFFLVGAKTLHTNNNKQYCLPK